MSIYDLYMVHRWFTYRGHIIVVCIIYGLCGLYGFCWSSQNNVQPAYDLKSVTTWRHA